MILIQNVKTWQFQGGWKATELHYGWLSQFQTRSWSQVRHLWVTSVTTRLGAYHKAEWEDYWVLLVDAEQSKMVNTGQFCVHRHCFMSPIVRLYLNKTFILSYYLHFIGHIKINYSSSLFCDHIKVCKLLLHHLMKVLIVSKRCTL